MYLNKKRKLRVYAYILNMDRWRHLETIKISIGNKYITCIFATALQLSTLSTVPGIFDKHLMLFES